MKKILALLLVLSFMISGMSFAATKSTNNVILEGKLNDSKLELQLQKTGLPKEIVDDILKTSKTAKPNQAIKVSLVDDRNNAENLFDMVMRSFSSVDCRSFVIDYYDVPIDETVEGTTATSISNIVVTAGGVASSKLALFTSGFTIIQELQNIYGATAVYPQSNDHVAVDGQIAGRFDKYTYVDLHDGTGERLGLISQKLSDLDVTFTARVFNRISRRWITKEVASINNKYFKSPNYLSPNSVATRNAQLNMSEDERYTIQIKNISLEIK